MQTQTEKTVKDSAEPVREETVNISVLDILGSEQFSTKIENELKALRDLGKSYKEVMARLNQEYLTAKKRLELANHPATEKLLKEFSNTEDLVIEYLNVIAKKSKLSRNKRDLIEVIVAPVVKDVAIDIINKRSCAESTSQEGQKQ